MSGKLLLDPEDIERHLEEYRDYMLCVPFPSGGFQRPKDGYVYLLKHEMIYKIGISRFGGWHRAKQIAIQSKLTTCPELICEIYADDMRALETELHSLFAAMRVSGEWFDLSPEDVEYIKSLGGTT